MTTFSDNSRIIRCGIFPWWNHFQRTDFHSVQVQVVVVATVGDPETLRLERKKEIQTMQKLDRSMITVGLTKKENVNSVKIVDMMIGAAIVIPPSTEKMFVQKEVTTKNWRNPALRNKL